MAGPSEGKLSSVEDSHLSERTSAGEGVLPSSTLEYINSQLVAHGYITPPGLSLDGISHSESERFTKCLLSMMSQRVEDMSRTEDLSTKLRTLIYDHERLNSMYKSATETAASAERDMNLHKSRLTNITRALQTSESAHKQAIAELQRTRTILQGVRASHHTELKKKEKDTERMSEKWSKIADAQSKHMAAPSGMRLANSAVTTGSEVIGKGTGFLEVALEEAERCRNQLSDENLVLRRFILATVNEAQEILHQFRPPTLENSEEPTPYTLTTLFPLHPSGNANEKLKTMLNTLRERLNTLTLVQSSASTNLSVKEGRSASDSELKRLHGIIDELQNELDHSRKQAAIYAEETRAMFDKFAEGHQSMTRDIGELSLELMTVPLRDAERKRLDDIQKELDQERQKFTEAAIKLGKERAQLEPKAEKNQLLDEKRSWQVEKMLAELPPTPNPLTSPPRAVIAHRSPKKSPKKSPAKICVGKIGPSMRRKTARCSRRSSLLSPSKVIPSYETEVLPPAQAPAPNNTNIAPPAMSILPTSFLLPPPSPHASLPSHPVLMKSDSPPEAFSAPQQSTTPPSPPSSPEASSASTDPSTPAATRLLSFPVAKPFAQRMIHAYSPAKPSPLSRILMLGNSPDGAENFKWATQDISSLLEPIVEGNELAGFEELVAVTSIPPPPTTSAQMLLADELDVSKSPSESPLQEKKQEPNVTMGGRVFQPDPKQMTAKSKINAGARSVNTLNGRLKTSAGTEKENSGTKTKRRVVSVPSRVSPPETTDSNRTVKHPSKALPSLHKRPVTKLPPASGGPRRVPVDSEEAPRVGKGWKG